MKTVIELWNEAAVHYDPAPTWSEASPEDRKMYTDHAHSLAMWDESRR